MAITDPLSAINYKNRDIASTLQSTTKSMSKLFGSVKLGHDYKEIAGMNENAIPQFDAAIDRYVNNIKSIIDGFNANASMNNALKGEVSQSVTQFLVEFKKLLYRYIEVVNVEKKEVIEASQRLKTGSKVVSSSISKHMSSVRSRANKLQLD